MQYEIVVGKTLLWKLKFNDFDKVHSVSSILKIAAQALHAASDRIVLIYLISILFW